jgi:hypothetical protein
MSVVKDVLPGLGLLPSSALPVGENMGNCPRLCNCLWHDDGIEFANVDLVFSGWSPLSSAQSLQRENKGNYFPLCNDLEHGGGTELAHANLVFVAPDQTL